MTVLGVDWYRSGWVTIVLEQDSDPVAMVGSDLADLIARVPDARCVAVDMPIGLPEHERAADAEARRFVGRRSSSVFSTPPASILEADNYAEANVRAKELIGKGISRQSWALRQNIQVVASVADGDERVIEVHPEVSFCALLGGHLSHAKTGWNGQAMRLRALAGVGIALPEDLGEASGGQVADVLDAAAAAWSARRFAASEAESLPAGAAPGARGVIWY